MRSQKGSRKIMVMGVEYRWRATGNDGYISIGIWPADNAGPFIHGNFRYHETWIDNGDGSSSSAKDQIVITNRIIERILKYAVSSHAYSPSAMGKVVNLKALDGLIKWDDAVRGINYEAY